MTNKMKVIKSKVKYSVKESIEECLQKLELSYDDCSPGERILLKINCNTADPFPASSDLEFVEAVIEVLVDIGCDNIIVGDSSTMMLKTQKVFEQKSLYELEKKFKGKVDVINFDEEAWIPTDIPNGKYIRRVSLPEMLLASDKLILLPCLKTHKMAKFTGALKLSVGFMQPQERIALHARGLQHKIGELNTVIHPCLIIMDARKIFINEGPSHGEIAEPNLIMASKSRIAIDTEGVKIIQRYEGNSISNIKPEEIVQIKYARELGIE